MRLLKPFGSGVIAMIAVAALLAASGSDAAAHPPAEPDHGLNETTFHTLWSGDADVAENASADWTAIQTLAAGTDLPLDAPPEAVEAWNRGELSDFPSTGRDRSIHPPGADLEDGRYIQDAYAAIAAVQPSTGARVSPSETPLYVAPDGTLLGTVDYRVDVPADDRTGSRRVLWRLLDHRISETALLVDSQTETVGSGSHTPALAFDNIDAYPGRDHTLTLVATIEVDLERTVRTRHRRCRTEGNQTTCWSYWSESVSHPSESITVEDEIEVTVYDLEVGGFYGHYPNGDLGLAVFKPHPWLGYSLPAGDVRVVWRFYAARDPGWDDLVTSTADGSAVEHSPIHPLQVYAYPFEAGPTVSPRERIELLEPFGTETDPPALPATVYLDVMTDPYVGSYGLATRVQTTDHDLSTVEAVGLVRGVSTRLEQSNFVEVPIRRSDLSLSVTDETPETVTVEARLVDAETGEPIETRVREGYLVLDGEVVQTDSEGRVSRTLPRRSGGVTARYVPGQWYWNPPGYLGETAVVAMPRTETSILSNLLRLVIPVSVFFLAVALLDRVTGWRLWPPWRGL